MISKITRRLLPHFSLFQFIRFSIVGIIGVTFYFSIFFILYHFFKVHYVISSATGFILGIFLVFFLNKEFTFKIKGYDNVKKMIFKYYAINLFIVLLSLSLLSFFVEILHINIYIANAFILAIKAALHFIISKFFVFR